MNKKILITFSLSALVLVGGIAFISTQKRTMLNADVVGCQEVILSVYYFHLDFKTQIASNHSAVPLNQIMCEPDSQSGNTLVQILRDGQEVNRTTTTIRQHTVVESFEDKKISGKKVKVDEVIKLLRLPSIFSTQTNDLTIRFTRIEDNTVLAAGNFNVEPDSTVTEVGE